jgi:hypothetical protein
LPSLPAALAAGLCVGHREARADRQVRRADRPHCGRRASRPALFVEALGHTRLPFAGHRSDHRAGIELAAIDALVQRKRRPTSNVDSMTVLRARRGGTGSMNQVTLRGRLRLAIPFLLVRSGWCAKLYPMWDETVRPACVLPLEKGIPNATGGPSTAILFDVRRAYSWPEVSIVRQHWLSRLPRSARCRARARARRSARAASFAAFCAASARRAA